MYVELAINTPAIEVIVIQAPVPNRSAVPVEAPPVEQKRQLNLPPSSPVGAEYEYWIEDGQQYCAQW